MRVFNRLAVILLSLALVAGAISLVALAWSMPDQSIVWLRNAVEWMSRHNLDVDKSILSAACALVGVLALSLFVWEIVPRSPSVVKVTDLQIGDAVLSTASIGQRVEEVVSQVPHVADARATIRSRRKGIEVALDLHVDPDANLALVTDEACQAARDVLLNRVHVALASPPTARLHYRELRMRGAPVRRAGVQTAPQLALPPAQEEAPVVATEATSEAVVVEPMAVEMEPVSVVEPMAVERDAEAVMVPGFMANEPVVVEPEVETTAEPMAAKRDDASPPQIAAPLRQAQDGAPAGLARNDAGSEPVATEAIVTPADPVIEEPGSTEPEPVVAQPRSVWAAPGVGGSGEERRS